MILTRSGNVKHEIEIEPFRTQNVKKETETKIINEEYEPLIEDQVNYYVNFCTSCRPDFSKTYSGFRRVSLPQRREI